MVIKTIFLLFTLSQCALSDHVVKKIYTLGLGPKGRRSKGERHRKKEREREEVRFTEIKKIKKPRMLGDGYHFGQVDLRC